MLRVWTSTRSQGLSDRFIASLGEPALAEYMQTLVHQLAKAWDGKTVTAEGLRRLDLRLVVDLDRTIAWWVIPSVPDLAEDILYGTEDGHEFTALLTTDPYSSVFEVEGLPSVTAAALSTGMVARGSNCVAVYQPSRLVILSDDPDAGGWMSVDALLPYEEHALLVASEAIPAVDQALKDAADSGWQRMNQSIADQIFGGYAIFYGVSFSDQQALETAMAALPVAVASNLRVGANIRPRLVNGLPIHRCMGRHIYFPGGEPDLALPVGAEPRNANVSIDGVTDLLPASIFPFPISRIGPWDQGSHHVDADGEKLSFTVALRGIDDRHPVGTGSLGWSDGRSPEPLASPVICGAVCAHAEIERPVLARRGAGQSWFILPTGQFVQIDESPTPSYFEGISFPLFEVNNPKATWLAQKRRDRWSIVRIKVHEANFRALSPKDCELWRELSRLTLEGDSLWQMYRTAWERFSGR